MTNFSSSFSSSFGEELNAGEPSLTKNDILRRRYRILMQQTVSEGHGAVYFCNDLWDSSPCVIKELPYKVGEKRNPFRDEAVKMAKLPRHKNVIKLLRIEAIGDSFFAVMEWLPQSMRQRLVNETEITPMEILNAAISICDGMLHCVEYLSTDNKPYVHGDLKPENLLISTEGDIKVADFGGGQTDKYSSPEQKRGGNVDGRSDIFTIGMIINEICDLCHDEKFIKRMKSITLMCCEYDVEKRPQSMKKLYDLLSELYMEYYRTRPKRYRSEDDNSEIEKVNRYCNLAILGEKFDVPNKLSEVFHNDSNAKGIARASLRIAETYARLKMYKEAVGSYAFGLNYDNNEHPEFWTGKSSVHFELSQFEDALVCSTNALKMRMSKSAPEKPELDYDAVRINILSIYELKKPELLQGVQNGLLITYSKHPTRFETLKYIAYTYYFREDYKNAIHYFDKYSMYGKDDYEMLCFYAIALYIEYDTTKAKTYFRKVIELIISSTNPKISRQQCAFLAVSYYCLNEPDKSKAYIDQYRDQYGRLPRKLEKLERLIFEDFLPYSCYQKLFLRIGRTGEALQTVKNDMPSEYYSELIEIIRQNRNEWEPLSIEPSFSYSMRYSNLCSFTREFFVFIAAGWPEEAFKAIDKALSYDRSSPVTLLNKAEFLFMLKSYVHAIPFYHDALKYQESPQKVEQIKRRLAMAEDIIKESPEGRKEFLELLLQKAASWNGDLKNMRSLMEDYGFMFNKNLCSDLIEHTHNILNAIFCGKGNYALLGNIIFCLGTMQQSGKMIFVDVAIQIYDILIAAGRKYPKIFSENMGICLSFRGLAYFEKTKLEPKSQAMEYAIRDFRELLSLPEIQDPYQLGGVYENLANFYLNRTNNTDSKYIDNVKRAAEFFDKALKLLNRTNAQWDIARLKSHYGSCLFELGNNKLALKMLREALNYLTIENDPVFFANTEVIFGDVSLSLLEHKSSVSNFKGILLEGIEAYQEALLVYNMNDSPQNYGAIILSLAELMLIKEEHYGDGSWLIAKHYYDNVPLEALGSGLSEKRKRYDILGKKLVEMTTNVHIVR